MDINKVNNEKKLMICKRFFYGGFALLPFLWLVNFCWFYKIAYKSQSFNEQNQIKRYINYSGIGVLIWAIILITWNIYFQINRTNLDWADSLSFILPAGRP